MFKQLLLGEEFSREELELIEQLSEEEVNRLFEPQARWFWFPVYPIVMLLGMLPLIWFMSREDSRSITDWIIVSSSILLMTALIRVTAFLANQSLKRSIVRIATTKNCDFNLDGSSG